LFPVGTVIGERLLYIPSAGFCLAVVVWLQHALTRGASRANGQRPEAPQANGTPVSNGVTQSSAKRGGRAVSRERRHHSRSEADVPKVASLVQLSPRRLLMASALGGAVTMVLAVRTLVRVRVWESAESLYIQDGQTQPKSSKVQFNLGITYMQSQDWDLAVEALVRCAWADPLSALPFYRIGQIEILRGRYDTAENYLAAAIDKFGASLMVKDEEVFHDLAVAMFQNGKHEQAETRLRVALQMNPDFAKGWNNLACCMISRSIHDAARASRKAVALAPENPQYWANLALLAKHTGDPATASGAWRRATELWPAIPEHRDCAWEFAPAG